MIGAVLIILGALVQIKWSKLRVSAFLLWGTRSCLWADSSGLCLRDHRVGNTHSSLCEIRVGSFRARASMFAIWLHSRISLVRSSGFWHGTLRNSCKWAGAEEAISIMLAQRVERMQPPPKNRQTESLQSRSRIYLLRGGHFNPARIHSPQATRTKALNAIISQ